jgi:cytosine/adenosine deaminase-related metal-dependent hydrolase
MKIISASLGLADAAATLQADFAVVFDGARIAAVGDRAAMRARYPQAEVEHFDDALLTPAFVNSHDHGRGLGTASLGIEDDALEGWLFDLWAQPEIDPYLAAAYDGARLLRSGVTLTAHSHNPRDWRYMQAEGEATIRGYRDAGIRVAFHPVIVDQNRLIYAASQAEEDAFIAALPQALRAEAKAMNEPPLTHDEYFALCDALFAAHHDATDHTVHIQISPAGGQWCSDALTLRAVEWAAAHNTRVQMHMLETRRQRDYAFRKWGKSFIRHLDDIGALGPWLTLAHMVWVEDDDIALVAERGAAIAHNPSSNLRLRSGIAPLTRMVEAGITLGIGLDGHALDDDQDYLREMRLAWTLANMRDNQPATRGGGLSAQQILRLGTAGGAATTLGQGMMLGALIEGALADFVVIGLDFTALDLVAQPDFAIAALLHLASRRDVRHVMANGVWAVRNGACTQVDEAALLSEIVGASRRGKRVAPARMPDDARSLSFYIAQHYRRSGQGSDG